MKIKIRPLCIAIGFALLTQFSVRAQMTNTPTLFKNYYYDYKLANPSLVGSKSKHLINTVYSGISGAPVRVVYGSYEADIAAISSGIGGALTYDKIGSWRTILAGAFYSYKFSLSKTSGLRFGTHIFYQHQTIDFSDIRLIDPVDPVLGSGKTTRSQFNGDLGVAFYSDPITIGIALKNVLDEERIPNALTSPESRHVTVVASRDFRISDNLELSPSLLLVSDFENHKLGLNAIFEIRQWWLLGAGFVSSDQYPDDLTFSAGVNIKGWVQIITHLYSSSRQKTGFSDPLMEAMVRVTIPEKK